MSDQDATAPEDVLPDGDKSRQDDAPLVNHLQGNLNPLHDRSNPVLLISPNVSELAKTALLTGDAFARPHNHPKPIPVIDGPTVELALSIFLALEQSS